MLKVAAGAWVTLRRGATYAGVHTETPRADRADRALDHIRRVPDDAVDPGRPGRGLARRPAALGALVRAPRAAQLGLGLPARHLSVHGMWGELLGKHAARPDARARAGGGAGRPPHATPPRQYARGGPHRVRHHRARQGPRRAE